LNPSAIVKPCQLKVVENQQWYFAFDQNLIESPQTNIFDPTFWQEQDAITGTAKGRGTTYFIEYQTQQWVLKHYFRGGLVGKLLKDRYLFTGIDKTRAKQEFELLLTIQSLGLPAPAPVAIGIEKHGFYYTADIITCRIADSQDVIGILKSQRLSSEQWFAIGKTIQAFHQQGIYHDDLNCHNILIDQQQKVWLIDFDRGEKRKVHSNWQQANLSRLLRSFRKEKTRLSEFYWQESDWQLLLDGYYDKN